MAAETKTAASVAKVDIPADSLIGGMAMALGYKQNAEAFFELFCRMKALSLQNEQTLFAYALRTCGFFDGQYRQNGPIPFIINRWPNISICCQKRSSLHLFRDAGQNQTA